METTIVRQEMAQPAELGVGTVIDGRYELTRDIGRGAGGLVFEARHYFTGRRVAIKVIAPDVPRAQYGELRSRLMREARALAAVRHRGVVGVLDGGVLADGTPYIVMEHLDGRTLEGLLATRGRLSVAETVALTLQICEALEATHEVGVVHRDIKPGNILVVRSRSDHDHIKLVDFGIAQLGTSPDEERLTGIGALIGTPAYMAPEQLLAYGDIDLRADIYAVGITMFEWLTGSVPYAGSYPLVLLTACTEGPPPRVPAELCPPWLASIVARAMAKKREERFGSARELADALREAQPHARRQITLLGGHAPPRDPIDTIPVPGTPEVVDQRRAKPRTPYATPLRMILPDGSVLDGRTEDISEGGLLVICRVGCALDLRVELRLALPLDGRIVRCAARVCWVRSARIGTSDGPRALGLEFIDLAPEMRASLARYVELMADRSADGSQSA